MKMADKLRVAVLASGRGSNLQALIDAAQEQDFPAEVIGVLCDKAGAQVLERAKKAGAKALWVDPSEEGYEDRLGDEIEAMRCGLICCSGYMKILSPKFVSRFSGKIINIHPSLLPAFPGLHSQRKALLAGVQITGCTVHYIDDGVDTGPIILQAAVPVLPGDNENSLSARILGFEHRIYPLAVRLIAEGRVRLDGRRVHVEGEISAGEGFFSPPVTLT